jgi:hypothetical protein
MKYCEKEKDDKEKNTGKKDPEKDFSIRTAGIDPRWKKCMVMITHYFLSTSLKLLPLLSREVEGVEDIEAEWDWACHLVVWKEMEGRRKEGRKNGLGIRELLFRLQPPERVHRGIVIHHLRPTMRPR